MKSSAAEYFNSMSPVKNGPMNSKSTASSPGRCHCCPYGYHIDLDFVRYCQTITQGSKNDNPALVELKRRKKARRRQTKSMEAMLGINDKKSVEQKNTIASPVPPRREKKKSAPPSPPPRKQSLYHSALRSPTPDVIHSSVVLSKRNEAASEALQEAVLDFEHILQSTHDMPKRKSRKESYNGLDLLHHTSTPYSKSSHSSSAFSRSNSLPRHFLHESPYSRWQHKDNSILSQSYFNNSNIAYNQGNALGDAMASLDAARGVPPVVDFDAMSVTSSMSGVSTSTLQSIRDHMATGLSRLKQLEDEVSSMPCFLIKVDILKEEKRSLLEELSSIHRGFEPLPVLPVSDEDMYNMSTYDLETRLVTLKKYSAQQERRRERKRSVSPMRVNLHDFHSYRRARRSSLSEGSDTESYLPNTSLERTRDRDESLYVTEWSSDYPSDSFRSRSRSQPSTPMVFRKKSMDASVTAKTSTRDVGVCHIPPKSKSIGTFTDFPVEEYKPKPCQTCSRRNQKSYESRSVGTTSPVQDSGHLSLSSLSTDSINDENFDVKTKYAELKGKEEDMSAKNFVVHRMGKKSPIVNRLSAPLPQAPPLTFDNSTNTTTVSLRHQKSNTQLLMDELYTASELNQFLEDAKEHWEASYKEKSKNRVRKVSTIDRACQISIDSDNNRHKMSHSVGIMAKPTTRDTGVGYVSIDSQKKSQVKTRNIAVGSSIPIEDSSEAKRNVKMVSKAVGNYDIDDISCEKCFKKSKNERSVGCGVGKISDITCDKCANNSLIKFRNVGVGNAKINDEFCDKCKLKSKIHVFSQTHVQTRSVGVEANMQTAAANGSKKIETTDQVAFGTPSVLVCDKCHETITSLAKDMVHVSPMANAPPLNQFSKIPRLSAELQKSEERTTDRTDPISDNNNKQIFKIIDSFKPKTDAKEISQNERISFNRQDTYTKTAPGLTNPGFDECQKDTSQGVNRDAPRKPIRRKSQSRSPPRDSKIKQRKDSISSDDESQLASNATSLGASSATIATNFGASSSTIATNYSEGSKGRTQPSRGVRAALKVLNDSIGKPARSGQQLTNAINIIQKDWLKICSDKDADPHVIEEYMDVLEEDYSHGLLLRAVNLADGSGNAAMHYAVSHGNFDVVSVLLDSKVCNVNLQNKAGYTAIMLVALAHIKNEAHEVVVKKLFDCGDVNIKASQHGQTALMLAVSHGRLDMVRMLLAAGADPNIHDEDGSTALMCAAEHGHLAIVRFLIGQPDTDLHLMDNDGSTALTIAVEAGHKDVGVLLYKQMNLSRNSSPHSSMRMNRRARGSGIPRSSRTPPPRRSAPTSPGVSRHTSNVGLSTPANPRQSSASLSNLNI